MHRQAAETVNNIQGFSAMPKCAANLCWQPLGSAEGRCTVRSSSIVPGSVGEGAENARCTTSGQENNLLDFTAKTLFRVFRLAANALETDSLTFNWNSKKGVGYIRVIVGGDADSMEILTGLGDVLLFDGEIIDTPDTIKKGLHILESQGTKVRETLTLLAGLHSISGTLKARLFRKGPDQHDFRAL